MKIDPRSENNMIGIHPDLRRLIAKSDLPYPIVVTSGMRTLQEQRVNVDKGASETMNSRHLTGHALDFAIFPDGIKGNPSWDFEKYRKVWKVLKRTADKSGIAITWGGAWKSRDGTHIQLSWEIYPLGEKPVKKAATSTTIAAAGSVSAIAVVKEVLEVVEALDPMISSIGMLLVILVSSAYIIKERLAKLEKDGV